MKKMVHKMNYWKKCLLAAAALILVWGAIELLYANGMITNYYIGILISVCINIILVVSLNLTTGFLGQLTLGHAGFMAVGAYGAAWMTKTLGGSLVLFPFSLLFGGLLAAVCGIVIGVPALRLKGDYLAIITLAFGEVIRTILLNLKIVGGSQGYYGIPGYTSFTIAYVICIICVIAVAFMIRSRHGRAVISIAEDEIASEASGINTTFYKILAFIVASFIAGIAGGLYAHYIGMLMPGVFDFNKSINILVMVVLGGMGNITGSIISAFALTILPEALRSFADYWMLMYSVVLIAAMLLQYDPRLSAVRGKLKSLFGRNKLKGGGQG